MKWKNKNNENEMHTMSSARGNESVPLEETFYADYTFVLIFPQSICV